MTKITLPCKHVSHTAWLVAAFRAQESMRPDAHFRDNLASVLLGELESEYLARFSAELRKDPWLLTVRTYFIDTIIEDSVAKGVKTIVNLGAGLDTRPYRLNLPADVQWIEADYADLIAYKDRKLKNEKTQCKLQRIAADLSLEEERRKVFERINSLSAQALVLTEGLLGYLSEPNVTELAKELFSVSSCRFWLMDVFNKGMIQTLHSGWQKDFIKAEHDDVQFKFVPNDTALFLKTFGWQLKQFFSFKEGAIRLDRLPKGLPKDEFIKEQYFGESGICLFAKVPVPKD